MKNKNISGSILIITLSINLIITLFIMVLLESNLLESKLSGYFRNKNLALINAENSLHMKEQMLQKGLIPQDIAVIPSQTCGVIYYRLTTTGKSGLVSKSITSTYAKINDISSCNPKPIIKEGRQSWKEA